LGPLFVSTVGLLDLGLREFIYPPSTFLKTPLIYQKLDSNGKNVSDQPTIEIQRLDRTFFQPTIIILRYIDQPTTITEESTNCSEHIPYINIPHKPSKSTKKVFQKFK